MSNEITVALVACSGSKLSRPAPARQLYTGDLFRKSAAYAEAVADRWYVLSAKHHLVHPDQVLEPYDMTLSDIKDKDSKKHWAQRCDLDLRLKRADLTFEPYIGGRMYRSTIGLGHWTQAGRKVRCIVLAGVEYREHLMPILQSWATVEVPLARLNIGQQKSWLMKNTPTKPMKGAA